MDDKKPNIGISSCLLGEKTRYDGDHSYAPEIVEAWDSAFNWIAVCPEVSIDLGVPRETIDLVEIDNQIRLLRTNTRTDLTNRMNRFISRQLTLLDKQNLHGFILRSKSPSCGLSNVPIEGEHGRRLHQKGQGLFAKALQKRFPFLPIAEDGKLNTLEAKNNFLERVFAHKRWIEEVASSKNKKSILEFHQRQKLQLLAHGAGPAKQLDDLVDKHKPLSPARLKKHYGELFFHALERPVTPPRATIALKKAFREIKPSLHPKRKLVIAKSIVQARAMDAPLSKPWGMIRFELQTQLNEQSWFNPTEQELKLLWFGS
jgi:uncharacterized protein YbbK (DUF523 family)/uncharacterized protein YbgA (DUF1722 family)